MSFSFCAAPNMINSVSQVHMVCLAIIHYLPCVCLRMSTLLLLFFIFSITRCASLFWGFMHCPNPSHRSDHLWDLSSPCAARPLTHHASLPSSCQLLGSLQLAPASGHPHMPFPLPAVLLFPHFPCGSLSSSRSLPQRGLLRPFSSLSCLSTSTTASHIVSVSWSPSPSSPPSTHLHL